MYGIYVNILLWTDVKLAPNLMVESRKGTKTIDGSVQHRILSVFVKRFMGSTRPYVEETLLWINTAGSACRWVGSLAKSSAPKTEAVRFSETSINFYQTMPRHNLENTAHYVMIV